MSEREIVTVGWDGRSRPMLRYADELHLPDSRRSIVTLHEDDTTPVVAEYLRTKILDGYRDEIDEGTADVGVARRLHEGCANEGTWFTFTAEGREYAIHVERRR